MPIDAPRRKAPADPESEVIARAQGGDVEAFGRIYHAYAGRVHALCWRIAGNPQRAEDLTQEVFVRAWRNLHAFQGRSRFFTWLYRIAVNTAKNYLESQGRRPPGSDMEIEGAELIESGDGLRDQATPERQMLTNEIASTVHRVLEHLPPDLRTAITLREIEGMSYEEIAEVMDCPIGTVRSRIFRAREAIDLELRPLLER